ncbi:intra-flagellar transport protein 57-domain-containing protein, partial [Blyttiomyces helicus]
YYFILPAANPNEQFYYFTSLFSWLMKLNRLPFEAPGQFDDPNASAANIAAEMKKLNVPFEYGPNKLKQGNGDAVLFALQTLVDRAIQTSGFVFEKSVHKVDDYPEEAEVDIDAEVTTDAIEEKVEEGEDEEEMFIESLPITGKIEEAKCFAELCLVVQDLELVEEVVHVDAVRGCVANQRCRCQWG